MMRMPAEFARHERTVMCWPTRVEIYGERMPEARRAHASVARTISGFEPVVMIAAPADAEDASRMCGETVEVTVNVRNFEAKPMAFDIQPHAPLGLQVKSGRWTSTVPAQSRTQFTLRLAAVPDATPGIRHVAFDITRGGKRLGELFDCIVEVRE